MIVVTCSLFYSHFRLHMLGNFDAVLGPDRDGSRAEVSFEGVAPPQKATVGPGPEGLTEIFLEALIEDPTQFPGDGSVTVWRNGKSFSVAITELIQRASVGLSYPLFEEFRSHIAERVAEIAPRRPTLLDIGGRARSGIQRSEHFPDCEVTTFDIIAQEGVDVVGDAHELSSHFAPGSFDFAVSIAVYEHLAMPWKAALEMAKVLRTGGYGLVYSHQTVGMHDLPWDFFRFSDSAWHSLFNRFTGFEIIATKMTAIQHIIPRAWSERYRGVEAAGGYEFSSVMVKKIAEPTVEWPVKIGDYLNTMYPGGMEMKPQAAVLG